MDGDFSVREEGALVGTSDNVGDCDCACIDASLRGASDGDVESTLMAAMRRIADVLNRHLCAEHARDADLNCDIDLRDA